jgi:hypothetical protein
MRVLFRSLHVAYIGDKKSTVNIEISVKSIMTVAPLFYRKSMLLSAGRMPNVARG